MSLFAVAIGEDIDSLGCPIIHVTPIHCSNILWFFVTQIFMSYDSIIPYLGD